MREAEKEQLLTDLDAGLMLLQSTKRPTPPTIERAVTIFKKVQLACQTIPITPVDESTGTPPTEPPIIDPAPPEIPPGGGGGGGVTPPPQPTTTTTNYTSAGDFSSVQGHRGWTYIEEDGTAMTYSTTNARWQGRQAFQTVWNVGQHPGATGGSIRRWTAPDSGTYAITGSVSDQSPGGSSGITFSILKNGSAIYSQAMADGGSIVLSGLTGSVVTGDTLDFLVKDPAGDIGQDGTLVSVSIALTTTNTSGTGNPTQTTLPFLLNGTAPQEGTLLLTMNKPANADSCTLSVTGVNLAAAYGLIYFNGTSNNVSIWPTAPGNSGISATVELLVPVAYVVNGQNTLRFTHTTGTGYTVTAVSSSFTTPTTPTPPATQTSLPFVLTGSILPEDGLLTINVSKPANPATCTVSVTGIDLAEAEGTMQVNSSSNSMTIWTVDGTKNGVSRTVNLSVAPSWFNNGANTIRFTHTSGDGFTIQGVSVSFTQQPDPEPPTGGTWPNQPSAHVVKTDWGFTTLEGNGWDDAYNGTSFQSIVSNQNGPISPPNALQARFPIGHRGGFGTGNVNYLYMPGSLEFYVGTWIKIQSPFQNHPFPGNKLFYTYADNGNQQQTFLLVNGSGSALNVWVVGQGGNEVDNRHLPGVAFTGSWNMVSAQSNFIVGQWNRLELFWRNSTSLTAQNGICRVWVNNTMTINVTNINTKQILNNGPVINPVYGGGETYEGQPVVKTQEDFIWFDHMIVTAGS